MTNIIIVFPRMEDGKNIRNLLVKNGFSVLAVCTTGDQVLTHTEQLNDGVVVCGYKFADMIYANLREYLPDCIDMLLVASRGHWDDCRGGNIVCVEMPIKVHELVSSIGMMVENIERRRRKRRMTPKIRSNSDKVAIDEAKALLMGRNNMTEDEAYRYLQKTSMESGTNMVEVAQMVLSLMNA